MGILEELDVKMLRARERKLKRHAAQIGRLCVLWSGIELDISHLLIAVANLNDPIPKNVLLGEMDIRSKIHAVLTIGFKRKPSEKWFDELSVLLNTIDNNIRPERNRMIHDFWLDVPDKDGAEIIQRVQMRASVKKEPPSGKQKLYLATYKPVDPVEISKICDQIFVANLAVIRLRREYERRAFQDIRIEAVRPLNPTQGRTA